VLTLVEAVSSIKDDLSQLKDIVQQQARMTQEHSAWLEGVKAVCQQQAETARCQAETVERLIAHFLLAQQPKA
jgi:methyl-accepting chemotaxis protein